MLKLTNQFSEQIKNHKPEPAVSVIYFEILNKKGIIIIPDILANAGGVVVSYFEWVQNLQGYYWSFEEVQEKETNVLKNSFNDIWNLAKEYNVDVRTASYMTSIKKIAHAMKLRGWY